MNRRTFLPAITAPLLSAKGPSVKLSIGNYGMQTLEVARALAEIQSIGYDGAELCLMAGWPSEPSKLDAAARRRIREQPLPIPSLIENLNLLVSDADHARSLDRIRTAATLAHDISPAHPPLLQTVLGGKPEQWPLVREKMVTRLGDWARVATENHLRLAVKSHIGSASDTPEKLVWLLDQVKSPALSAIYDYSHFQLLSLKLDDSLKILLPRSSFLTVKDGRLSDGKPQFLLPGEGTIDYRRYFNLLRAARYQGWILVEISRQLQILPSFDPLGSARQSYQYLSPLLQAASLRPQSTH